MPHTCKCRWHAFLCILCDKKQVYKRFSVLDWKAVVLGKEPKDIPWKWEEIPLQIKTDSLVGSGDKISIDMKRANIFHEGIGIKLSSPVKFWMAHCNSVGDYEVYTDLPVQPPEEVDKIWTFIKTNSALMVTCNHVEVLNYKFAKGEFENCVSQWGGDTTDVIRFDKNWDTASDFYRAG